MKKLIITADDYGMSRSVNDAIDAGIEAGLITSTNVMVNMPLYQEAIKLKEKKGVSVGIHWVLACGKPILPAREIPTLVNAAGEFYSYPEFRRRLRKKRISLMDVKKELLAQYKRYYELMGQPDYWNTHQNTHVDFGIYRLFVDTAIELGIGKMRSHQRIYVKASDKSGQKSFIWRLTEPIKSRIIDLWQYNTQKKGVTSPDGIICRLNKEDINKPEYLFNNIDWKNSELAELVIHPATENDSPYFGKIADRRIAEYKLFTSQQTKKAITDAGIELTTF